MKGFSKVMLVTIVCSVLTMVFLAGRFSAGDKLAAPRIEIASECSAATSYTCVDATTLVNIKKTCVQKCWSQYDMLGGNFYAICKSGCEKLYSELVANGKTIAQ